MAETVPAELRQTSEVAADLASRIQQHMTRGGSAAGHNDPTAAAEGRQADSTAASSGAGAPASIISTGGEQQQHQEHHDSVPEGLRHTSEAAADLASRVLSAISPPWSVATSCAPGTPTRPLEVTHTSSRRLAARRVCWLSRGPVREAWTGEQ